MTFAQLVTVVGDYCNLSSSESTTRIGKALNRHYRRITSELGLNATRFVTRSVAMTVGQRSVTFTEIEKIDRILDTTDATAIRLLTEVSQHTQRTTQPSESAPNTWSFQNTDADSVVILTDTVPQTAYSLQADGWVTLSDLSGSDEPVFPESYHDILSWYVIAEELLKKEKDKLSRIYESKADKLLSELRFFLADSPTLSVRARNSAAPSALSSSGGGGGSMGGTAYTQTSLLTFDMGPGVAPFAVDEATAAVVTNLDADKLDGQHGAYYLSRTNHTGAYDVAGSDTQVQFNDGGVPAGDAGFTFNKTTNIVSVSGVGFPASQSASSDANTLDDYEEGTFLPTMGGSSGESGQVYASQSGHYVKVGKLVHWSLRITMTTSGTIGTNVLIGNLPFTCDASAAYVATAHVGYWESLGASFYSMSGYIASNTNWIVLTGIKAAAASSSTLVQADMANGCSLFMSGSYKASA